MQEYSDDAGKDSNPDGYIFTEGDMITPFYEAAMDLNEGEVSEVVKSSYGYHIILRQPLDENKYSDHQADIATKLGKTMDSLLNEWMTGADVETTDTFGEITYKTVYDYAPADVAAILNSSDDADSADTEGDTQTDGTADTAQTAQ